MIDFRNNLNVKCAIVRQIARFLAKEFVQPPQVFGASLDRHVGDSADGLQWPAALPGKDDASGARWQSWKWAAVSGRNGRGGSQLAGDPGSCHECRNGDVHHPHGVIKAHAGGQPFQDLPQRVLGQFASYKMDLLSRVCHWNRLLRRKEAGRLWFAWRSMYSNFRCILPGDSQLKCVRSYCRAPEWQAGS